MMALRRSLQRMSFQNSSNIRLSTSSVENSLEIAQQTERNKDDVSSCSEFATAKGSTDYCSFSQENQHSSMPTRKNSNLREQFETTSRCTTPDVYFQQMAQSSSQDYCSDDAVFHPDDINSSPDISSIETTESKKRIRFRNHQEYPSEVCLSDDSALTENRSSSKPVKKFRLYKRFMRFHSTLSEKSTSIYGSKNSSHSKCCSCDRALTELLTGTCTLMALENSEVKQKLDNKSQDCDQIVQARKMKCNCTMRQRRRSLPVAKAVDFEVSYDVK